MKNLYKKIVGGCLVAATLVGCSGDDSKEKQTEDGNKVVKLRMMGYNPESARATYLKYLSDKLPNIEIEFEFVSQDNFDNVLNTQLQAGEGPDIIELGGQVRLLANANYLLDISNEEFITRYSDAGLKPFTVNGKVYAAPLQSWYEGIYYNKQIFDENGLEVPKTWDEFLNLHKVLQAKGIKPQTIGAQTYEPMMKQAIGLVNNMFYSDPKNKEFDEKFNKNEVKLAQAWLPALQEWNKAIEQGYYTPEMLGMSYDQALDEFATGKAAMWQCGPWAVETIKQKNPNLDFKMFPIPGLEPNKPGWLVGGPGSSLGINAKSKHIKEALEVLDITATKEAQLALIKDNAGSSFLKGVNVDLGDMYSDCSEAFAAGNVYAPWTAVWINGNATTEGLGKSLQEVLAGTKNVKQALEDADKINSDLLETLN